MRDPFVDCSKGLLIFLVVFGHFVERLVGWGTEEGRILLSSIYAIHMPAFILISGMFFKNKNISQKVIYFLSLLVPFQLFYLFLNYALTGQWSSSWWYQPYWILWYMFGMLCWTLLTPLLLKTKAPLLISVMAAVLIGYSPINNYILSIGRVFTFLPFFIVGHLYGKAIVEYLKSHRNSLYIGLLGLLGIVTLFYFVPVSAGWLYGSYRYIQLNAEGYIAAITRLGFMLLSMGGTLAVLAVTPLFNQQYWIRLGENTLPVYLLHGFVVMLFSYYLRFNYPVWINILLCFSLSMFTCWILQQRIFSHMIEKMSQFIRLQKP